MAKCVAVQQKLPCVFVTGVQNTPSNKRANQPFKVVATDQLHPEVDVQDLAAASATEKVDGTCCLIAQYQGVPWLWARLDRKPNREGERKFKRYQSKMNAWNESDRTTDAPTIQWDNEKDFKSVPATWIAATGVETVDGAPLPDSLGHTPGWVPLEKKSRQYCWHLTAVDLDLGLGLVLAPEETSGDLVLRCQPLSQLCGKTCELIGTNINGNAYGLGSRQQPLHALVVHGSLPVLCPSPAHSNALHKWFVEEGVEEGEKRDNQVEGVVWHCPSGALFKLHRHHLNLPWPVKEARLSRRPVRVEVDGAQYGVDTDGRSQLSRLAAVCGQGVSRLRDLHTLLLP